ncbi:hypothetical protein [Nodularia sp. UHCC 0506]|uniref:hypothetical protein n=1 Tax=Nodularia sp. UHCC 0506 TaxID=3110243 RepID=UPI002B1F2DEE|nr:hypothetical protein [Nodularia sp. UHCC 0506]MEA5516646.1 hypothetical protein [Nodularia sp. UHCC 0506]
MDFAIRYLLHEQADKYNSEDQLYIISKSDALWEKLAQQVLSIKNESWRLINSTLAESIPEAKFKQLGISRLTKEVVINLLQELRNQAGNGISQLAEIELNDDERREILNEIGKNPENKPLWKALPLHKTVQGHLVSITENTYVENENDQTLLSLNQLPVKVTLIKKNANLLHLLDEDWIPQWNASAAMRILLAVPNPHHYTELILKLWESSSDVKNEYHDSLKQVAWLSLSSGEAIAPNYIIKYPNYLQKFQKKLIELNPGYYLPSHFNLPQSIYKDISRLFSPIKEQKILEQIFNEQNYFPQVIFAILDELLRANKLDLEQNILYKLQNNQWLLTDNNQMVSPSQVVYIPKFGNELETILVDNEYIPETKLNQQDIKNYKNIFDWLRQNLFIINNQAWDILGKKLGQSSCYFLGSFSTANFPLDKTLEVFKTVPKDILPAWKLIQKVVKLPHNQNIDICKRYILPNILEEIEEERLIQLLNWISKYYHPSHQNAMHIYNEYLKLSTENTNYNLSLNILPNILLLSHNNQWQHSYHLWYGEDQAIKDIIDHKHILNKQQAKILESHININVIDAKEDFNNTQEVNLSVVSDQINTLSKYDCLTEYFQNWKSSALPEAIGAFICLVAGSNKYLQNLAQEFVGKRDILNIFTRFTDKCNWPDFEFDIEVSSDKTQKFTAITGHKFTANLSYKNTYNRRLFVNPLDPNTRKLVIRPIENPEDASRDELHEILYKSAKHLIHYVYQIDTSTLNEKFQDVWNDLIKSEQLELKVARNVILRGMEFVVEMLGVNRRNEIVKDLLNQLQRLVYNKEERKNSKQDYNIIDQEIDQIQETLANLLEDKTSNNQVASDFLECVRQKISVYGYHFSSIPFEIFQNADDSLIELEKMGGNQSLESSRLQFILEYRKNTISMMYWGRPINCFRHPQYNQNNCEDQGFERDLQKMLSFSQSNKYHTNQLPNSLEESDTQTTGKFGLGFKSVHLICQEPHIVSYRTAFKIIGGWLPSKLSHLDSTNLSFNLSKINSELVDGTIIQLKIDPQVNTDYQQILKTFHELIGLLLVFANRIRTYTFLCEGKEVVTNWHPVYFQEIQSIQIGLIRINQRQIYALCFKLGNIGHFLISVREKENGLESCLTKDIPTIWVTAPTKEILDLNFIINGQFDLNPGRSNLIEIGYNKNLRLAQELGKLLGEILCLFFEQANENWKQLQELLSLNNTSHYQFWYWMWQELVASWLERDLTNKYNLIRGILGGNHGMGYLLTHSSALPNGLFQEYQCLVSPQNIRYVLEGILKQEEYFINVFKWQKVKEKCHHSEIIHSRIWQQFQKLLNVNFRKYQFNTKTLNLLQILQWQLPKSEANIEIVEEIGSLINPNNLQHIQQNNLSEYAGLITWLKQVRFLSQAETYQNSCNLLVKNSEDIEEKLLSAFAPDNHVLNTEYITDRLEFFYACRPEKPTIEDAKLIEWIKIIKPEDKERQLAVKEYIYLKNKYSSLSDKLLKDLKKIDWLQVIVQPNISITELENSGVTDKTGETGEGDIEYGDPGEELARLFYKQIYSEKKYQLDYNGGLYDYLLSINGEKFKIIEVKTISSKSIRFPVFEWNLLGTEKQFYELFIVLHSSGNVHRVIRIKNVWETLTQTLKSLELQYLTQETKDIESLIGLQKDKKTNQNVIILNWQRLIDSYKTKSRDENIMIYNCYAKLIKGQRKVEPDPFSGGFIFNN